MGRGVDKLPRRLRRTREIWRRAADPVSALRGVARYNLQGFDRRWTRNRRFWSLGADPVSRARLVLGFHRWRRSERRGDPSFSVSLDSPAGPVRVHVQQHEDFWTCLEIFGGGHYEIHPDPSPVEWLFDLGCNTGIATRYLVQRYRPRHKVAVEADPVILELARRNLPEGVVAIQAVVAEEDGRARFLRHAKSTGSSVFPRPWTGPAMELPARSLDSLCRQLGAPRIDVLKFDIEGAEFAALPSSERARDARILIGEVHGSLVERTVSDFLDAFPRHRWTIRPAGNGHHLVTGRLDGGTTTEAVAPGSPPD